MEQTRPCGLVRLLLLRRHLPMPMWKMSPLLPELLCWAQRKVLLPKRAA